MIGPLIPLPAPRPVIDALAQVEVQVSDIGTSGFTLTFSVDKQSPVPLLFLLTGGNPILFLRVVIVATVNGIQNVLMDGVITKTDYQAVSKGSNSTLMLYGEDLTAVMNQSDWSGFPFPAMTPEMRVLVLLAKYALFGLIPIVIPSIVTNLPLPTDQIPSQQGTDLAYIRALAAQCGYVFYIAPGPVPGTSTAYWGPQVKVGPVQPALSGDMDAYTNVESIAFKLDQQQNKIPIVFTYISELGVTIPIPIPPISPLAPPLGAIPPLPTNIMGDLKPPKDDLAKRPFVETFLVGMALSAAAAESVRAEGSLDVVRYGGVLKARQLVGVRGAGPAFDGLYYVNKVKHKIKRGEFKQDFELSRNGLKSTVSQVTP